MACCHRRGSVHDLSIGGSVCHDRGDVDSSGHKEPPCIRREVQIPMQMGNFEGKRGGPLDGGPMIVVVQCL